ncbi:hypothetical protein J3R83DRAFT_10809 [Lanmaoa asiatica]|nr:hypothetical protein J3R83DRAFT_10809 [Lanmaoa asiatica]
MEGKYSANQEFSNLALQAAGIDTQRQPTHVIRQSTARPNIQFLVTRINNDRLFEFTVRVISHHAFQSTLDRGIVFCEYVDDAKKPGRSYWRSFLHRENGCRVSICCSK